MTPWTAAGQASLSINNSQSLLKLVPIESLMPSKHLILCHVLLLLSLILPSIRAFSNEYLLHLSNTMKQSHDRGANQDGRIMVERSDRTWSTGEGNGKPLQYSCLENPMNSMKRQNDRMLKEELPRSVGAQYVTGDQWRKNSRKNEGMEPKQNKTLLQNSGLN